MPKLLFVLAERGFSDDELRALRSRLVSRGVDVRTAGKNPKKVIGTVRLQLVPDVPIHKSCLHGVDGVVVLGGHGARKYLWGDRDVMQLVEGAALEHKILVGVGLGAVLPAQATLLVGKDATCAPEEDAIYELRKHNARYVQVPVVEADNGVITASGPEAAEELVHLIMDKLSRRRVAEAHPRL
ncbi:MAG: DJ-1/PfpI family protein [Deltaproteobacteria bacterium]|nr:DJ-1/PfpI family protein [Deltaproteobacteria bacterium]